MKVSHVLAVLPVASLLAISAAYAQSDKTPGQADHEPVQTLSPGDVYRGDIGLTERGQGASGITREQVRAELAAAVAAGDVYRGDIGMTEREHGSASAGQSLSRAQVVADLASAKKAGQLPRGDIGMTDRESFPARFPVRNEVAGDLAAAGGAAR